MFWIYGREKFTCSLSKIQLLEKITSETYLEFQNLIGVQIYICSSRKNGIFILFILPKEKKV